MAGHQVPEETDRKRDGPHQRFSKINRMEIEQQSEKYRMKKIESALKRKFPDVKVDKSLLGLVGTMPYNLPSKDKKVVRRIIAWRHA